MGLALLWDQDKLSALRIIVGQPAGELGGDLLTIERAAEILAVSVQHVTRLTKEGKLPAVRVGDRSIRYDEKFLRQWIAKGGLSQ